MKSIWNNIQKNLKNSTNFTKLLYFNIGIFLSYKVLLLLTFLFQLKDIDYFMENYLYLPASSIMFISKPWTIISYMFIHTKFFHLLFNMIWLHFGSKLFLQYFNGKQLLSVYILGGIFGGFFYMLCFNFLPVFTNNIHNSVLLGASASVIAIFIAVSYNRPNYRVTLPFIGNIKLKHIALSIVILDLVNIEISNPGGHISHLGGAIFGFLYVSFLKKGMDISVNFYKFIGYFSFSNKSNPKKNLKRNKRSNDDVFLSKKAERHKQINIILEKISKSGYDSLSKDEKEILFKESKK